MNHDDAASPSGVNLLACSVADGTASPEDAKQLLSVFVEQMQKRNVSERMLEHMRDCITAYLDGVKAVLPDPESGRRTVQKFQTPTLDKAFGVKRLTSGQPRIDRDTHCAVAMEVLQAMLDGESSDQAARTVATYRKEAGLPVSSDSQVHESWRNHKQDGLLWLKVSRAGDGETLSTKEIARLTIIYADVLGALQQGEEPFTGRHSIQESDGAE